MSNPVASDQPGGTNLIFTMDNFLNPYSGIPRTGFTIQTGDNAQGLIDSSVVASLPITVTVTQYAAFDSITFSRVDTMQTVAEVSIG